MPIRARTPIPDRRRTALACAPVLAVAAALAAFTVPAQAQLDPLSVTAIDPAAGLPGDPVVISGTGFGASPDALLCWADTGDGGFPFAVEAAADGRIDAVVGEVALPATGSLTGAVKVWRGKRYPLADRVTLSQGRLFAASDGEVFVRRAAAVGPDFSSFGGSPGIFGSVAARKELRLDLDDLDPGDPGGPQRVRVVAVIETSDDSGNSNTTGNLTVAPNGIARRAGLDAGPAWAATTTIETDAAAATSEALAAGLAEVLQAQLGSLGLTARAEGTELVIGHGQGIGAGFVHLVDLTGK